MAWANRAASRGDGSYTLRAPLEHWRGRYPFMLQELTIRNFALLEYAQLRFGPGLTVLTGETGAGKSIIIDAIGCVLGGRASSDVVRAGTERAIVEAIFDLDAETSTAVRAILEDLGLADVLGEVSDTSDGAATGQGQRDGVDSILNVHTTDLILHREIGRNGRSIARLNGRTIPAGTLAQVGAALIDIHGQHDHLSLLRAEAQRDLLDRYGGLLDQRASVTRQVRDLTNLRATRRALQQDEREVARRLDMLGYQVDEIARAELRSGEDEALSRERTRLASAGRLMELGQAVLARLTGDSESNGATDLAARASRDLESLVRIDPDLAPTATTLAEAEAFLDDVTQTIRTYVDQIEFNPERQSEVEQRLELITSLQKKYGPTIEEILGYSERAEAEIADLVTRDARSQALENEIASLETELGRDADALSVARHGAGVRLAAAIGTELRALSLKGAFETVLSRTPDDSGVPVGPDETRMRCDQGGIDTVAFHFAPNPGEPSKPVARTASGGELSRILLALKAVLSQVDHTPTLIFDEVDTGVGGRNAQVLGEKLAGLGTRHQVFCITHLPQVAAYGDGHYFLAKHVAEGRTSTEATPLDLQGRAHELAQMLGGATPTTLAQATELLTRAEAWKQTDRLRHPSDAA
ncbi:MAG: DNA repair protein RecN [Proteobacteria bacterium]|nr:DNA repair protein RecN [Pseudomonadota bacterium]NBQ61546.1 DNA repair protein RecN [Pseudomonadota bacterium]NBT02700.1 DNA repair protein RecN [Pseudomonadota bacterium]NCV00265.1 DNA repair protein RecN [Pseudomonadota bacterium]NDB71752.1 DNA repair protein RecN [Pseudomonadota bacterium]